MVWLCRVHISLNMFYTCDDILDLPISILFLLGVYKHVLGSLFCRAGSGPEWTESS